uniref:Major facilitator superfamily (MFS) profile domain-containing protein n=1 Tax=Bionectria ochroleuca TaxID=29856 RepID=A0A8H7N8S4_BIOOC
MGHKRVMLVVCMVAALNCASVGYDSSMMSSLNILLSFQQKFRLDAQLKGLLTAVQNLGAIVAGLFSGLVVDRWGRKGGILVASILVLISCAIHATSTTRAQFFVGRVLVGVAKAVDIAAVPTYLVEMAPPGRRGFVAGLYWTCWLVGAILSAGVGYGARSIGGDWSWRTICICMAGPAASCIASLVLIPESPRWLISRGREQEGLKVLAKFHGNGDTDNPLVVAEFREIKETIAMEKAEHAQSFRAWWKKFASEKSNRLRAYILLSLGVFEQTVGSSIITYYLSNVLTLAGITSESQQFAINIGQNCVALVAAIVGTCVIDRKRNGTKWNNSHGIPVPDRIFLDLDTLVFLLLRRGAQLYHPCKSMGFYSVITSSAGFFNQYVIPIGLTGIGWRFYIVGVCWNVFVAIVIAFTYIETKGLTLEQIAQRFEGVPRGEVLDVIEAYDGGKPITELETCEKEDRKQ